MNSLHKSHMLTWKLPLLQLLLLLLLPCWHVASAVQRNERDGCWQHREHVVAVCLDVSLSVCLSLRVGDGSGKWFMPFYRGGVRSIDKIASNYTVRAGFGIGFSLRCWRFCQLANCFFVFALVSPAPSSPAPFCPTATPTHVAEATAAGGAGTLAWAAWQSFYFVRVWILFSWHSNTYAPPLLPHSRPPLAEGGLGLSLNMQVTSANGAKNPLQQPK